MELEIQPTTLISTEVVNGNVEDAAMFNEQAAQEVPEWRRRVATAGVAGVSLLTVGGLMAACGNGAGSSTEKSTLPGGKGLVSANTQNGGKDCVTSGELSKNIAETNTPSKEAIFQSMSTQDKDGNQILVSTAEATKKMREQVCGSPLALATVIAIKNLRDKLQAPNTNILDEINGLYQTYLTNPSAAETDEEAAYTFLAFLQPVNNYPIITGEATQLVSDNDQKSVISAKTINGTNNFSGFEIYFNTDNSKLTAEQVSIMTTLSKLVLFNEDGTVVFNKLAANYTINLEQQNTKVGINPNTNNPLVTVPANPNTSNGKSSSSSKNGSSAGNSTGSKTGTIDTQNTVGGGGGSSSSGAGSNEGNGNGTSLNNSGTNGTGTGSGSGNGSTGGSGGNGGNGGETGTTHPGPVETVPPTTHPTSPPTTHPAPPVTSPPETTPPVTSPPETTPPTTQPPVTKTSDPGIGG